MGKRIIPEITEVRLRELGAYWIYAGINEYRNGRRFCLCVCKCGRQKWIANKDLFVGKSLMCVSCRATTVNKRKVGCHRENMKNSRLYRIWSSMRERCYNWNHKNYHNYGGRGISICENWSDYIS